MRVAFFVILHNYEYDNCVHLSLWYVEKTVLVMTQKVYTFDCDVKVPSINALTKPYICQRFSSKLGQAENSRTAAACLFGCFRRYCT